MDLKQCFLTGETGDAHIKSLRVRQMKIFHSALMISQGTPIMLMGDEYGHTRYGNNNSYGHDTALNNFQWKETSLNILPFLSELIKFRHSHHVLKHENFLSKGTNQITWHEDNWDNPESKFLAFTLHDGVSGQDQCGFQRPGLLCQGSDSTATAGKTMVRVADTNLDSSSHQMTL
ncbi:hypothetical protein Bca52824_002382 [Brassica carinata]|uniref:Uncharacterized protein n=1 Tax=Brassica carinata TaxID=52824 RepID=A0A8X7WKP2_BRACI|nr:hypothetical protein Bca52824_002382 [Brassica carinata]